MKRRLWALTIGLLLAAASGAAAGTPYAPLMGAPGQTGPTSPPAILTFNIDLPSITVAEAEAGQESAILSWHTVNVSGDQQVVLERYVLNAWQPLEETLRADSPALEPVGELAVIVRHPLNFGPPTYRLSILDADGRVLDERVVVVPYDVESVGEGPTIEDFSTGASAVSALELAAQAARVVVGWEVANRTPTSNLIFEQVLPDGSAVPVELPRPNLWVASRGQGPVAPALPGTAEEVTLRLRLVDLVEGDVLDEQTLTLPIVGATPTAVPSPTAVPPTATPVGVATSAPSPLAPTVVSMTVSPDPVDRGGTVTVNWEVRDATRVTVYRTNPSGQFADYLADQPLVGSWVVALPEYYVDSATFVLYAEGRRGETTSASVTVQVNCPYTYFFGEPDPPQPCPLGPATDVQAAYQPFEGGHMLWRSDTGAIYVLTAIADPNQTYGQVYRFRDTWVEGEEVAVEATPPVGLYQPVRGFGKVWAESAYVRDQLGWATAPEEGYTMRVQTSGAYRYPYTYMTLPDGRLIYIVETSWAYLEP